VANQTMAVSKMKNPSKRLGKIITGFVGTRDMTKNNLTMFFPPLNSKELDVNVMRSGGGMSM
jgi:hypothetical protein